MNDLEELKKRASASLLEKINRTGRYKRTEADLFPEEIAREMETLQAEDAEKQKKEIQNQAEMQKKSDSELDARIEKNTRLKNLGLAEKYDPRLAEHALEIFPNLKQFGMASQTIPEAKEDDEISREPAGIKGEIEVENSPNLTEEDPDYAPIKGNIMKVEGGWSDDPRDTPTMKGVTLDTYSNYLGRQATKDELKNISDKEVDDIFRRYYNEAGGSKIKDPRVREFFVDQNFNKGTRFLNRINDLVGTPRSSSLSQEAIDKINEMDPNQLLSSLLESEREEYDRIIKTQPKKAFAKDSWYRRLDGMAKRFGIDLPVMSEEAKEKSPQNIEELLSKVRQDEDRASTTAQFAKLRDAIIGVGAGRTIATDTSTYDEMRKKAKQPIEDMLLKTELEDKQAKNDPNSQISKLMRKSLEEMGVSMKGFEKVSFAQLEKLYPSLVQSIYNKLTIEAKKTEAVRKATEKAEAKLEKLDQKKQKDLTDHINFSINNLKKSYEDYSKSKASIDAISNIVGGAKNGITPGSTDITMLYTFISNLDPASTVRDSEIALSKSAMSLWGRIKQGTLKIGGGDLLDSDTRKSIEEIMKVVQAAREKQFAKQKANLIEAGVGKGLDKTLLNSYIYPEIDALSALSKKKELTPEEKLQKYEEMINRVAELQSKDTRNKKGN